MPDGRESGEAGRQQGCVQSCPRTVLFIATCDTCWRKDFDVLFCNEDQTVASRVIVLPDFSNLQAHLLFNQISPQVFWAFLRSRHRHHDHIICRDADRHVLVWHNCFINDKDGIVSHGIANVLENGRVPIVIPIVKNVADVENFGSLCSFGLRLHEIMRLESDVQLCDARIVPGEVDDEREVLENDGAFKLGVIFAERNALMTNGTANLTADD